MLLYESENLPGLAPENRLTLTQNLWLVGLGLILYGLVHKVMSCFPSPWTPAITYNGLIFFSLLKICFLIPCLAFAMSVFFRVCRHNAWQWLVLLGLSSMATYPLAGIPFEILAESWTPDNGDMNNLDTSRPFYTCVGQMCSASGSGAIHSRLIPLRPAQQLSLKLELYPLDAGSTDGAFSTLKTVSVSGPQFTEITSTISASVESHKPDWMVPIRVIPFTEPYFWRSQTDYRSRLLRVNQAGAFELAPVWLILLPLLSSLLPLFVYALDPQHFRFVLLMFLVWTLCFTPWLMWWLPGGEI